MKTVQKLWVDFNSLTGGRIALDKLGTREDLKRKDMQLEEGLELNVYQPDPSDEYPDDELRARGHAHYDTREKRWVLILMGETIHTSEFRN